MKRRPRLSPWPYALLGAMSLVSFGGPFLILVVVWGGAEPRTGRRTGCSSGSRSRLCWGSSPCSSSPASPSGGGIPPPRRGKAPAADATSLPERPFTLSDR